MKRVLLGGLVGLAMASVAQAQEPVGSWAGLYAGIEAGYGFGTADWTNDPNFSGDTNPDGFFGGAHIGYNFQSGAWVFGPEISVLFGDMEGSGVQRANVLGATIRQDRSNALSWAVLANARVGYEMGGWLPYLSGGLAVGEGQATSSAFNETVPGLFSPNIAKASETHVGFNIGVGVEKQITSNLSLGLDYKYIDLGSRTYNFPLQTARNIDLQTSVVGLRLNYRMN